jgi:ABC-type phosphate/phosphonate transport system substrate-binding protein
VPRLRSRSAAGLALAALLLAAAVLLLARPGGGVAATPAASPGPRDSERFVEDSCAQDAVRFGVVLARGDAAGRAAADRLTTDLSEGLGCEAITVAYATQARLVTALAMHDVDVAQLDPAALVVADRVTGAVSAGAYAVDRDTPARARPTELWVRRGSRVSTLADLAGRPIAFGPRLTTGGDVDPRTALLRAGVRTGGDDDTESRFVDDDVTALAALRAGRVDAAITRDAPSGDDVAGLRRVWSATGPLADVLVLRPGITRAVRRLIQVAVRGLPGAALAPLAARQGISEPAPLATVPLDLYAPIASRLDDLAAAGLQP